MSEASRIEGPFFEDLVVGQQFSSAPRLTLTEGVAAVHQSILGDRLELPLDRELSGAVSGRELANPALVWNIAIGQSTLVTRQVKANLFYRGLVFHRAPAIGDTLSTITEVVALKQNKSRADRANTGLVALRMTTTDQDGRPVLDFFRCAMLPLHDPTGETGRSDDIEAVGALLAPASFDSSIASWDLDPLNSATQSLTFAALREGDVFEVVAGDVVSSGPELARLTLNIAAAHHDAGPGGRRLVYGGHTIGLALAQASRALPSLVTVTGWHSCDHLSPVYEGDTVHSSVTVEKCEPLRTGGLVHLRSRVTVADVPVLDWRFVGLMK